MTQAEIIGILTRTIKSAGDNVDCLILSTQNENEFILELSCCGVETSFSIYKNKSLTGTLVQATKNALISYNFGIHHDVTGEHTNLSDEYKDTISKITDKVCGLINLSEHYNE